MSWLNLRNLTVRGSLMLCAVLVIGGNIVVLGAYLYSASVERSVQGEQANAMEIRLGADAVFAGVLNARTQQQAFVISKDAQYADQQTRTMGDTIGLLDKLKELSKENAEMSSEIGAVDDGLVAISDSFDKVFQISTEMGLTPDLGLQGTMRGATHAVEDTLNGINQIRLVNTMLQMRRHEKDFLLRGDQKYVDEFKKQSEELQKNLATSGLDEAVASDLGKKLAAYVSSFEQIVAKKGELTAELTHLEDLAKGLEPRLRTLDDLGIKAQQQAEKDAGTKRALARSLVLIMLIGSGVVLVGAFLVIMRRVGPPLVNAAQICAEIAEGDLSRAIESERQDEIGGLLKSLAAMNLRLREVVGDVRTRTNSINTAAREIATGNTDLSKRTEAQAANLEETASSMEEMTSTVKQNADNARQANQLANAAREQAEKGGNVVSGAITAMGEINTASRKIADIIGVVDEIAFQTNLLALNAAVEAARAGEQGRGFAVVATEVRNLAQRSAQAAKEIKELISDSVNKVSAGAKLVDQSGATLAEIVTSVKKVSDIISEIAAASLEQSEGIEQVNGAVMQMDEMTQQNAALVEQAAANAKSMEEQADAMSEAVAFFKLGQASTTVPVVESHEREYAATPQRSTRQMPMPRQPAPVAREQPRQPAIAQQRAPAAAQQETDWEEF